MVYNLAIRRSIKSLKNNKRGSLVDIVFISVFVFAFSITCLIGYSILQMYNEQVSDTDISEQGKNMTRDAQASYGAVFDGLITFILVGLSVALMVSVMMIKTHPGFLWISLFLLIIFGVLFFVLQESWKDISETDTFSVNTNATASFPITDYIMNNFLSIFIVIAIVAIIIMYAKFGGGWN